MIESLLFVGYQILCAAAEMGAALNSAAKELKIQLHNP
jgi:hypothetical protein